MTTDPDLAAAKLDIEIGARLRQARKAAGMNQTQLGDILGVSFQQVQKYERGSNRISSSALIIIARALDISPNDLLGDGSSATGLDWKLLGVPGSSDLLAAYAAIGSTALRRIVLDLSRQLAKPSNT